MKGFRMPRANPETITVTNPWSYTQLNGNNFFGNSSCVVFRRDYTGGLPTVGYPRRKITNSHSVTKRYIKDRGTWTQYYSFRDDANYGGKPTVNYVNVQDSTIDGQWWLSQGISNIPSGCPYSIGPLSHDKGSLNKAIDRAIDAVADRKINLAQVFAERAQTVRLIQNTLLQIGGAAWMLRRGNWKGACESLGYHPRRKPTGQPSKDWLALQYGWLPLLNDVKGAAETLAQKMLGNALLIKVQQSAKYDWPDYSHTHRKSFAGDVLGDFRWDFNGGVTNSKCQLTFTVNNQFQRDAQVLGITDPLTLAWELLPWSFVIDWFIPIGNFVQRLNYDSGLQYVDGFTTQFTRQSGSLVPVGGTYTGNRVGSDGKKATSVLGGSAAKFEHYKLDRIWLSKPPRPSYPRFKDPFSPVHVLNALALAERAFARNRTQVKYFDDGYSS